MFAHSSMVSPTLASGYKAAGQNVVPHFSGVLLNAKAANLAPAQGVTFLTTRGDKQPPVTLEE
jgi:hypothetical protein